MWVGEKLEWKVEIGGCGGNRFRGRVKCKSVGGRGVIEVGVVMGLGN